MNAAVIAQPMSLAVPAQRAEQTCPPSVPPLAALLRQLADLLLALDDEQYCRKPVGLVASSIGGHVRHCLDHVDAVLAGFETGEVNYDHRQRGTGVETDRQTALECLARQERQLFALPSWAEERPLRLSMLLSSALPPFQFATTVGRELAFLLSHTIHHNALVAVMAKTLNAAVPDRFGYAPSTIAHLENHRCVR